MQSKWLNPRIIKRRNRRQTTQKNNRVFKKKINKIGRRSLVGCSPWGREESDTTEWLHFSLSCIGEGNGNPLQCSCLENPRDGEAWWAAVSGVAQRRTWLKRLSSSSIARLSKKKNKKTQTTNIKKERGDIITLKGKWGNIMNNVISINFYNLDERDKPLGK